MLASLIIVFREVLEAGLIIGIVLAATRGVPGRGRWVAAGVAAGIAGACGVAAFADVISDQLDGSGQELFNAAVLLTAVAMLAWHNAWMARHGREHAAEMRAVGRAVESGDRPPHALAVVVGAAVLREGAEVVLFLAGIVSAEGGGGASVALGALGGIALGAVAALLVYRGLLTIATRHLFGVTSWMITLRPMKSTARVMSNRSFIAIPLVCPISHQSPILARNLSSAGLEKPRSANGRTCRSNSSAIRRSTSRAAAGSVAIVSYHRTAPAGDSAATLE